MNIAIIPARGGSKRIPRKNIKQFCGKPMIAWPIEVAKQSKLFDKYSFPVKLPRWRVQDIDTKADWKRAEFLLKYILSN